MSVIMQWNESFEAALLFLMFYLKIGIVFLPKIFAHKDFYLFFFGKDCAPGITSTTRM